MANYNKSFNFRNGVQVDTDNFIVNQNGLVGIGTTILKDYILNVFGDVRIVGILSVSEINTGNLNLSGISSFTTLNVGVTSITSGIVTASSGVVTYYGDGSKLSNLPTSQWVDVNTGIGVSSIYAVGNVGIATTSPSFTFQVGANPLVYSTGIGINSTGDVYSNGIVTAVSFSGNGSNLTSLNASNITSGTISTSRFPSNITLSGIITASSFVGSGASLTSLNASNITSGTLSTSRLPSNIIVSGIVTASGFVGNLTGTASTANSLSSGGSISVNSVNSQFSSTGVATVTDTLYVVGFPAKIGVGTNTAPQADIEVRKSGISSISVISDNNVSTIGIGRSAEIRTGNTNTFYLYSTPTSLDIINSNTGNVNYYLDYGSAGLGTGAFHWIYGQNPSNPLMSLTYDGKLGLGITNPPTKLYVVGSSYFTGVTTIASNLTVSNNLNVNGNITFNGSITGNLGITTIARLGIATDTILSNSYEFFVGGDPIFGDGVAITKTDIRASGLIQSQTLTTQTLTTQNATVANINSTGIITANSFRGDGSQLTGIVASGSGIGIGIRDDEVLVGTATTINFGNNLIVSPVSSGVVTVTVSGGGGSQTLDQTLGYGNTSSEGMSVGVSTFNNVTVGGATTSLIVNGDARITGILTIGTSSITLDGSTNTIVVGSGITIDGNTGIISATSISINGETITGVGVTYIAAGSGISVDQNTGTVTISATGGGGGGSSQWVTTSAGIHTTSNVGIGTTNPVTELEIYGGVLGFGSGNIRIGDSTTGCSVSSSQHNFFAGIGAGSSTTSNEGDGQNIFIGLSAGYYNIKGGDNIFLGCESGYFNNCNGGYNGGFNNNFFGNRAGYSNIDGSYNNFLGAGAGCSNIDGSYNNFFGRYAGFANTTGSYNNFFGNNAGRNNTTGYYNNFFGYCAGSYNTIGSDNTFFGAFAGAANTTGNHNNFFGAGAGGGNTTGSYNNSFGRSAGQNNTTGCYNNFFGKDAGFAAELGYDYEGSDNNLFGRSTGAEISTGSFNNFFGACAGLHNTTGSNNNFFGKYSGYCNTTGCFNNFLGVYAGQGRKGRITSIGITSSTTLAGEANNSYPDVSGTGGDGSGATFYVERDGNGDVTIVNIITEGQNYNQGNTLTIDGSAVGGSSGTDDITITVDTVEGSTGSDNNFFGRCAGLNNTTGSYNNFFGEGAGKDNTDGRRNNFLGASAGCSNTTGCNNNFFGNRVGLNNITGNYNNFFGKYSGYFNTTESSNNFFGQNAGSNNTTGCYNNFFGKDAGSNNITGSCNIAIGHNVQLYNSSGDNQLAIGVGNSTWIIGDENFNVGIGTTSPTSKLTVTGDVLVSGVVTATSFSGDGSQLTGITGSGSGINAVVASFMF